MDEAISPPREAVDRLGDRVGRPLTARLLSDRRGSRAWKVHGPWGAVALKANVPGRDGAARDKAAELAQEDTNLGRLVDAGALCPGYRVDAGDWTGGRWLAVRWAEGRPVWEAFAPARSEGGAGTRSWVLGVTRTWAGRLARLHAVGWAHADVQPTNALVAADGRVEVIDYALACGPDDRPCLPYRGALTHTTAPEIAEAVLLTPDDAHVRATPEADVWGLGASLHWCWTGRRPVAYEDGDDRAVKLAAIASGARVPLPEVRPWRFPEYEAVIAACLAPVPEERPSTAEVVALLSR
ncbi:protein kinase domain-containing protein [Streptomyces hydrogenans]|uniref:protein kinase domain-containing protein n=1 Tax=Streptomyces hydrogenans TaxID=1873719 RepID=UPI003656359B